MNGYKEEVMEFVEKYGKAVEHEAYDNVLKILYLKFNQLDNLLSSREADNIFTMSMGERFNRLCEKRRALRLKIYLVLNFIEQVSELKYGKF